MKQVFDYEYLFCGGAARFPRADTPSERVRETGEPFLARPKQRCEAKRKSQLRNRSRSGAPQVRSNAGQTVRGRSDHGHEDRLSTPPAVLLAHPVKKRPDATANNRQTSIETEACRRRRFSAARILLACAACPFVFMFTEFCVLSLDFLPGSAEGNLLLWMVLSAIAVFLLSLGIYVMDLI